MKGKAGFRKGGNCNKYANSQIYDREIFSHAALRVGKPLLCNALANQDSMEMFIYSSFLTRKDILFEDPDVLIPVRAAVLVEEADSVAQLMDNIPHFAPQCWAAYRQFLHFVAASTNAGSATRN